MRVDLEFFCLALDWLSKKYPGRDCTNIAGLGEALSEAERLVRESPVIEEATEGATPCP